MANPAVTARSTPTGYKMKDGFRSLVAFAAKPSVQLWEIEVKPGGIDGGEPIDTTTMHNSVWHTMAPQSLKKSEPVSFKAGYDPDCNSDLLSLVNVEGAFTVHYPTGDQKSYFGYLQKVDEDQLQIGKMPTVNVIIIVTNYDPTNNIEVGPLYTAASGT